MPEKPVDPCCSYCGKSQHEVMKLIAGPTVYICDQCIKLCNDIIAEEAAKLAGEDQPRRGVNPSSPALCSSFCGKQQHEVQTLIAGPSAYICNECVGLCNDIIAELIETEEAACALQGALPNDVRAFVLGVLKRGLPAAEGIDAVLQKRIAGTVRYDELLWTVWSLASEFDALHRLLNWPAPEATDRYPDDAGAEVSGDTSSGHGAALPGWVQPIVERIHGTAEVLDVLARRIEEPSLEDLRPPIELGLEKLREARELLLAGGPKSPTA